MRRGKKPTTAAGEFIRDEMHHVKQGKHGARSSRQAVAIGLSKARRAGVPLAPPKPGQAKERTRRSAQRDLEAGRKRRPTAGARRTRTASAARKRRARTTTSRRTRSSAAGRRRTRSRT